MRARSRQRCAIFWVSTLPSRRHRPWRTVLRWVHDAVASAAANRVGRPARNLVVLPCAVSSSGARNSRVNMTRERFCVTKGRRRSYARRHLEEEIRGDRSLERIIGKSSTLRHVLQLVETVAPSDSTVLLLGETGTGKELIARAIHESSRRKERTFVKLNCAAIPTGLKPLRKKSGDWNLPIRAPSSWTKWETFQVKFSRNCSALCRSANSNALEARIRAK
jgi:hypothetical protein